jgi:cell division protein ZapA
VKQIEVSILGQVYMLGSPEGGETLLRNAVATVDREMTVIRDAGKVKARERIAVLAALNLAYQLAERGPAAAAAPAAGGQDGELVDSLLQRIDAVLSEDGQLL